MQVMHTNNSFSFQLSILTATNADPEKHIFDKDLIDLKDIRKLNFNWDYTNCSKWQIKLPCFNNSVNEMV